MRGYSGTCCLSLSKRQDQSVAEGHAWRNAGVWGLSNDRAVAYAAMAAGLE